MCTPPPSGREFGSATVPKQKMTSDEFLLWAEAQEGRWELHDGVAQKITPERIDHVLTKGEAYSAHRDAVQWAGCECEVFGSGGGVQIDDRTIYAPDGAIVCGPRLPDDDILLTNLVVVVEVLSPSTAANRPWAQAERLFFARQRRALSHSRSRAQGRHPSQARPGRCDRDAGSDQWSGAARSAGLRGRGRGVVPAA